MRTHLPIASLRSTAARYWRLRSSLPDRATGAIEQVERGGPLRLQSVTVDHRYQAFREHRRRRDELAVGRLLQSGRIARQRYRVGTFPSS